MTLLAVLAVLLGASLVIAGVALWSIPAALVVAALALAAAGLYVDIPKGGEP